MFRRYIAIFMLVLGVVQLAGCNGSGLQGMLGKGWGDLGDETAAGPYRFRLPAKFTLEKQTTDVLGETKYMYRGPRFGKSEPGIVFTYGVHHQDFSQQAPDWSSAVNVGLTGLRSRCNNFQHQTGPQTSLNGIPAARITISGDLTLNGETRPMSGIGYLMIDETYLAFVMAMDFGAEAQANAQKMEAALKTIARPGHTMPAYAWTSGGGGAGFGGPAVANLPPASPGPMGSQAGAGPAMPPVPGVQNPSAPASPFPGMGMPPGPAGYPGPAGNGASGLAGGSAPMSGYPGSSPPGMSGPGMPTPGMSQPGMPSPGMGPPGAGHPGMPGPGYRGSMAGMGSRIGPRGGMGAPGAMGSAMHAGSQPRTTPVEDPAEVERRAELARRKAELLAAATDPQHAQYHQANIDLLRLGESSDKRQALDRLSDLAPDAIEDPALKKELARATRDVVENVKVDTSVRRAAIPLLVAWGGTYSVPILVTLLEEDNRFLQIETLDALTKMQDERAIEPVTMLFVKNASLRREAADCLRSYGTAAESTVLEVVRPTDFLITQATVQLLGDIGTRKSIDQMRLLRKLNFYKAVQSDVTAAVAKIRKRETPADKS